MSETLQVRDERRAGHHWADNEVLDQHGRHIGVHGYAIYMFMARHANNLSGRCTKTQREIAWTLAISEDTVQRAIGKLIDRKLVTKELVLGKSCVYVLLEVPKFDDRATNLPPTAAPSKNDVPLTAVPISTPSTDPPPTAACDTPLTAVGVPPTAAGSPLTAARNKERRLIQDSIKTKPSATADAASVDHRHRGTREMFVEFFAIANEIARERVPWDAADAQALNRFLARHPLWEVDKEIRRCLLGWFRSDVKTAMSGRKVFKNLGEYLDAVNEFDRPRQVTREHAWKRNA